MSSLITVLLFLLFVNVRGVDYGPIYPCSGRWIPKSQSCNGKCSSTTRRHVCPSNPAICFFINNSCDGRLNPLCKENYCGGNIEDYPFYNISSRRCLVENQFGNSLSFCRKREGAIFHNNQCSFKNKDTLLKYYCLNRMDISETVIRQTSIYKAKSFVRLNLFELFESNDTHITCGSNSLVKNLCPRRPGSQADPDAFSCKGHEISKRKVCGAIDFITAKNYSEETISSMKKLLYIRNSSHPKCDPSEDFICTKSRQCIRKHLVCNGNRDCDMGEDEDLEECIKRETFPVEATLPCYELGRPKKYQVSD